MLNKTIKSCVLLIVCFFAVSSMASESELIKRMTERLPVIAQLKAKGVIGEDNKGYLGFVGGLREQEDVIAAENKDRKAVYLYLAKDPDASLEVVEKIQANRKAQKAKPGEFIQNPDGSWVKK